MLPSTRAFCANSVLVRELLPFLLSVVQPVLRPINTQLYSAKEKADLKNLVNIHIAYNISYQQERNMEGQVWQFNGHIKKFSNQINSILNCISYSCNSWVCGRGVATPPLQIFVHAT